MPSHMGMINHIVSQAQKTGKSFYPQSPEELKKMQGDMMHAQSEAIKQNFLKLKAQYKEMNVPVNVMDQIDDMIRKIDLAGVRTVE